MIVLRRLELKDIPYMLEWMHDTETKLIFQNDFLAVDEVKAENFILNSFNDDNKHFAIVDNSNDEYLGTISLKNIDNKNRNAEYAISTRSQSPIQPYLPANRFSMVLPHRNYSVSLLASAILMYKKDEEKNLITIT